MPFQKFDDYTEEQLNFYLSVLKGHQHNTKNKRGEKMTLPKDVWTNDKVKNDIWEENPGSTDTWKVPSDKVEFLINGKNTESKKKEDMLSCGDSFDKQVVAFMKLHKTMTGRVFVDGKLLFQKEAKSININDISTVEIITDDSMKPTLLSEKLETDSIKPMPAPTKTGQKYHTHAGLSGKPYGHLMTEKHVSSTVIKAHNATTPTIKQ